MDREDSAMISEGASVGVIHEREDHLTILKTHTNLKKFSGDSTDPADLVEEIDIDGNMIMYGGASNLWESLIGSGSSTPGNTKCYYNNANAAIGVGDSGTAEAATQNDLVAASNKLRVGMDATYPLHTDGQVDGADDIVFRSTFTTAQANWTWSEWGIFNSPTAATGRMLNRKVEALGVKTTGTWQLTLTLSLGTN